MKSENEIRARLQLIEEELENSSGHDQSHLIGQRNMLEWVLGEDDPRSRRSSDHWTGQTGRQRR